MRVLMVGCDKSTKGGMWKVVENYLESECFMKHVDLEYVPTSITGKFYNKIIFTFKAYIKIFISFIKNNPDILHVHMSERGSVFRKGLIISLAKIFNIKIIIHMHGAEFETWYNSLNNSTQKKVVNILMKADKVIILGQYWYDFISTLCPKDKIYVLHNAVSVPNDNKYNSDARNLLFLGVVGQRKGAYDLLDAFEKSLGKIPSDVNLLYYGPDFEKKIEQAIEGRKMCKRVKYMGWLSESDKKAVFNNTMLNILPSYNEGLPMTILETMAYGIPNISTKVAAIPEVIDETNGVLLDTGNVDQLSLNIIELVNSKKSREIKSEYAYTTIKKEFSLESHMVKLINLYQKVLKGE